MKLRSISISLLFVTLLWAPELVLAEGTYQSTFNKLYKIAAGSSLAKCNVCHKSATSPSAALNPYGNAFRAKFTGGVTVKAALKKIQRVDSDKDGFKNLAEIKAGTLPGLNTSKPAAVAAKAQRDSSGFTTDFMTSECEFESTGSNSFFVLEPGYQLVYAGQADGVDSELTITVLDDTKVVNGVETRVVEEVAKENGQVAEVARNYFAICEETNTVFYFGEDVDIYENGQVVSHDGSWLAGVKDAEAGVVMPGIILLGSRYYQELAPCVRIVVVLGGALQPRAQGPRFKGA
jgi:hypothetical protein